MMVSCSQPEPGNAYPEAQAPAQEPEPQKMAFQALPGNQLTS
jgi:hypothetical protein